jgi:hypothetical protein
VKLKNLITKKLKNRFLRFSVLPVLFVLVGEQLLLSSGCLLPPPLPQEVREKVQQTYQNYEDEIARIKSEKEVLVKELEALREKISQLQKELNEVRPKLIESEARRQELEKLIRLVPPPDDTSGPIKPTITPSQIITSTPGVRVEPSIKGKILGVNRETNLVVLSVGQDNQVKTGFIFNVYRAQAKIGEIVIDLVEQDWSSGHSHQQDKEFQVGDEIILKNE